jgi:phosphoesterase family protein
VEATEDETGSANLEKVDHVVVVMLENRSFDHMLGYLSLSGRRPDIDGLRPGLANEYQGRAYPVHHLDATAVQMDPDHSSSAIDRQIAEGTMSGFVASAAATLAARGNGRRPGLRHGLLRRYRRAGLRPPGRTVRGLRPLVQLGARRHAAQPPVRLVRDGGREPG